MTSSSAVPQCAGFHSSLFHCPVFHSLFDIITYTLVSALSQRRKNCLQWVFWKCSTKRGSQKTIQHVIKMFKQLSKCTRTMCTAHDLK